MTLDSLYETLTFVHLSTIGPAFLMASYMIMTKKGSGQQKCAMIALYVGGMLVAGGFTLVPGRFLGDLVFG